MTAHIHQWTADRARNRFVCTCGVIGHRPSIIPGQHRTAAVGVQAYRCKYELDGRKHCGADAVHVTGDRNAARCAEHAPACALCTSNVGPFASHPFGRNNAIVSVCRMCDQEHPRSGRYSFGERDKATVGVPCNNITGNAIRRMS